MIPLKKMKTPTTTKNPSGLGPQKGDGIRALKSNKTIKERVRQDVRFELVERFKGYLQKGTYKIKAPEIAEKMVQKISENKQSP